MARESSSLSTFDLEELIEHSTIFTGGTDCLVRIHKAGAPDAEPGFYDEHQKAVTSLACSVRLAILRMQK